jgi:predicted Zn finger-like uncharacterized protein
MARIFWVTCPACEGRFYAHYDELRHSGIALQCPYCQHEFLPSESPAVDDRG